MKRVSAAVACTLMVGLLAPPARTASPPKLTHDRLTCAPADGNARITATITSSSPVVSARVYYHSVVKTSGDYYVELRKGEAGNWWGILPIPLTETTAVQYRIVVKDAEGQVTTFEDYTVPTSTACPVTLTADETRAANNLVIGLTTTSQPAVPDGFSCKGVAIKITVAGEMMPNEECRKVLAAGFVIPPVAWAVVGVGAGAATGAVIAHHPGPTPTPCSCPVPPAASARK